MTKFLTTLAFALLTSTVALAQLPECTANLQSAFEQAEATYPNLPQGLLKTMAYAASHYTNIRPEIGMTHHHGPQRYGLFALVENGEGYFRNTLLEVCQAANISTSAFKADEQTQVMAVAKYLNDYIQSHQLSSDLLARFNWKDLCMSLCELPSNGLINDYAREQYAYNIYKVIAESPLTTFARNNTHTTSSNTRSLMSDWFTPENLAILSSRTVTVESNRITGDNGAVFNSNLPNTISPSNPQSSVATTDYAPALWVSSPNFSSRGTTAISAVTIHTTQGSYAGSISWFQNTTSQVSAHYVIRSSDGQVTQMVLESNKAWHVGSENPYTIGIEHEGYVADATWYTTAMYTSSAALVRDICASGYGILPTTCYNGPASSGGNVLATSIKIKGHQHFPNQTHVDPGINWNWALYYNLINSCAAPTGLAASGVTLNSANLAWTAVSGASSYTVEYKTAAATTWTAFTALSNSATLTGLANATTYNWRVKTNCSTGGTSAVTTGTNFTTLAPPCGSPSALTTSGITATGATLTWAAVSGASNYTVQYKTSAATTWTSVTATSNTTTLSGLASSTIYNWQVKTNCATNASSYVAGANFTTLAPPCTAPTGLSSSNLFTTKATISWAAVAGATSYQVEYKTAAATTWTVSTQTTTSKALTGLSAATQYQYRVMTICSASSSSAYSATGTFTTLASCYDANEANNSSTTATVLAAGSALYGKLCTTTTTADADWYKVTITSTSTITVSVTELPANYNLDLYVGGAWVAASVNTGTTNESLTRTAQPAGTYYFRVYSATASDVNSLLDYKITAAVTPAPAALEEDNTGEAIVIEKADMPETTTIKNLDNIRVLPNPVSEASQLFFDLMTPQNVQIQISDSFGRIVYANKQTYDAGVQQIDLNTSNWMNGVYIITIQGANERQVLKILK